MGEMKHLVVAKFKEGVVVDEIIQGMVKLVSDLPLVSSFEWGKDLESPEMLRQGFTHAFLMTFKTQEDFAEFLGHPKHVEFSTTFSTSIENVLLLDFPAVVAKPKEKPAEEQPPLPAEPPATPADPPVSEQPAEESAPPA